MANPQIATVLIPCYVVQKNNQLFRQDDEIIGQVLQVPCRNVIIDDVAYWATPVKDAQIFTTLYYQPVIDPSGNGVSQPTFDSFLILRVRDKLSDDIWWIYVNTHNDFVNACETCCGSGAIPMPGTLGGFFIQIAPCDTICLQNTNGTFYSIWGLPNLVGHESYYPFGSYNNVALPAASGSGYSTPAALLSFMNSQWTNQGSPNATFVWTLSADNLTLTATGGFLNDTLCVVVSSVGSSS